MKPSRTLTIVVLLSSLLLSACNTQKGEPQSVVTGAPQSKAVTVTERFACQIHAQRHIRVRAPERGYLEATPLTAGNGGVVKQGDPLFRVIPIQYQTRLDAELAEAKRAQLEYNYAKILLTKNAISQNEVSLLEAKLLNAKAKAQQTEAERNITTVRAPFDGIVDRTHCALGSLLDEGEVVTRLNDNSVVWAYFNVPESRYLQYLADPNRLTGDVRIELILADGTTFPHVGTIGAVEADVNNKTEEIPCRAQLPNPDGLLRHGQRGSIIVQRLQEAAVLPKRATRD